MATGARGRERVDKKPGKVSSRRARGLQSLGILLDPSLAANDADATQSSVSSKKNSLSFSESTRRASGKKLAANKAVVAEEKKDCGLCLICGKQVEASCGTWLVFEGDGTGQDAEVDRHTCSIECEKEKKSQPKYLGNPAIKWKKVTHF